MSIAPVMERLVSFVRKQSRPLMALVVAALSVVVGMGVAGTRETLALAILGSVAGILCLVYPLMGCVLLVLSAFSVEWLVATNLAPSNLRLMQDALSLAVTAAIIVRSARRKDVLRFVVGGRWMLLFLAFAVIGVVLNGVGAPAAVLGFRPLSLYVPLAVAPLALDWSESERRGMMRLLMGIALFQPAVALVQFLFFRQGVSGDAVSGTLGGYASGHLTAFMIAMSTLMLGMLLYRARRGVAVGLSMAWLALPPALNETKVFFAAAPAVFVALLFPRLRQNTWGAFTGLALVTVMIVAVFQSYAIFYGPSLTTSAGVEMMIEQETSGTTASGGVLGRLPSVVFATETAARTPSTLVFGHGAGSLGRSSVLSTPGRLIQEYGALVASTTFLSKVILEYGFLGLITFSVLSISVVRAVRRLERAETEPFWRAVAFGAQGMALTMILLSVYTDTFTSDPLNCALWLMVGLGAARLRMHLTFQESRAIDNSSAAAGDLQAVS